MTDPSGIHSLARPNCKSGKVRFIHTDGEEHSFYSVVNDLSGDRLSGFDSSAPSVNDTLKWVKSVFRDIRAKAPQVLEVVGDF